MTFGQEKAGYVQQMFAQIAPRYDLMNRLMTGGQDIAWRQQVIRRAALTSGARVLDIGAGTGDLIREALRQHPDTLPVAADFTLEMMQVGRTRDTQRNIPWTSADAQQLPFPEETFDAVVSGFLMRNVTNVDQALEEQVRVLKPGGRVIVLDTTKPRLSLLSPFVRFHLHTVIPFLGGLITGERGAYTYLPQSTENFLAAEQLAARMVRAGLTNVSFQVKMLGTVAIHWGYKKA